MQDRKQQRLNDFYTKIWRRDAICKLVKVGVRFKKEPKNKEIEKYLLDNYIPFQDVRAFCLASYEAARRGCCRIEDWRRARVLRDRMVILT